MIRVVLCVVLALVLTCSCCVAATYTIWEEKFLTDPFAGRWTRSSGDSTNGVTWGGATITARKGSNWAQHNSTFSTTGYANLKIKLWTQNSGGASADRWIKVECLYGTTWTLVGTIPSRATMYWEQWTFDLTSNPTNVRLLFNDPNVQGKEVDSVWIIGDCTTPSITSHPSNQSKCDGETATFSATASGSPLSYTWQISTNGGSSWSDTPYGYGARTPTFSPPVGLGDNGNKYRCRVENGCGTVYTNAATLTVNTEPSITAHPSNQVTCEGETATFSVTVSGTNLSYQWRKGTSDITNGGHYSGATTATLTITNVDASDEASNYNCYISNPCGNTTSNDASLTMGIAPSITGSPEDQTKNIGETAIFSVTATGTGLIYQWQKKPVGGSFQDISGAQSASYETPTIMAADDGGQYRCVVTGTCSPAATSEAATLTVRSESISSAKMKNDYSSTSLIDKIVTAVFSDHFYIEEPDRSSGIQIVPRAGQWPIDIAIGKKVDIGGLINTNAEDERYIDATTVANVEDSTALEALGMTTQHLGGTALEIDQ
jgi:hypothetical protein